MSQSYSEYLKLERLLALQTPLSDQPEHDELLFIIVHQVYELWFKEVLHEFDALSKALADNEQPRALHTLKRILTIFKTMVAQLDILETMTPRDFLSFRDRLESASGFQSFQFREIEFLLGLKSSQALARFAPESFAHRRLLRRWQEPTIWDAFLQHLTNRGYGVPEALLTRDPTEPTMPSETVQRLLVQIYREDSALTQICERLVDLDEGLQEWRYRHVKMVQRTIGHKVGTGGSSGVDHLLSTLHRPVFPDLWAIRSEL
ncbi:MAG: tryptophan 2,3-dioxygenase [Deltaproteobacteria bacterium]|nr:tryptophan 2,3-dioxygenase [Deltaproteobacteria bacterium]